jgi:phosphoribosylaminoimidazolecarboxamide formyltransferase/IMP cyclohydrolase
MLLKPVRSALISVYYKNRLLSLVQTLKNQGVTLYSTGGTLNYLLENGFEAIAVEDLTGFPEILGGRVKTLHPKVFGGILARRDNEDDDIQVAEHHIPNIDMVIVNLYPFEETVEKGGTPDEIIEKIDIGGISLIRAAAKNHKDVCIVSQPEQYEQVATWLKQNNGSLTLEQRKQLAVEAFKTSALYDSAIARHFAGEPSVPVQSRSEGKTLRYGENPHQKGLFFGQLDSIFTQLHGKEISYNNLVDIEACLCLLAEFNNENEAACIIVKHTNACGVAVAASALEAYETALACDPTSAFGGVIGMNRRIDLATAEQLNLLFFEILVAPGFDPDALTLLQSKKNRILLNLKAFPTQTWEYKSLLGGLLVQEKDNTLAAPASWKTVTKIAPTPEQILDLEFANKVVKHTKSNTIVLVKNRKLLASGTGQTSRVDALQQAIEKAKRFGFNLHGGVMASDAFFPFPDCVNIACQEGIEAVIQPGGSMKDQDSIAFCDSKQLAMVFTGIRHFKH